ncbi:hypothetical protein M1373_02225 [Candidatus Marsarchaeota archaeon]|nr:hypothetical protein [Candidatus Marsarchaeota archaeon]MCL5404835.1 hypothetical protein [Candidatus Marsarchaeota archaeon]
MTELNERIEKLFDMQQYLFLERDSSILLTSALRESKRLRNAYNKAHTAAVNANLLAESSDKEIQKIKDWFSDANEGNGPVKANFSMLLNDLNADFRDVSNALSYMLSKSVKTDYKKLLNGDFKEKLIELSADSNALVKYFDEIYYRAEKAIDYLALSLKPMGKLAADASIADLLRGEHESGKSAISVMSSRYLKSLSINDEAIERVLREMLISHISYDAVPSLPEVKIGHDWRNSTYFTIRFGSKTSYFKEVKFDKNDFSEISAFAVRIIDSIKEKGLYLKPKILMRAYSDIGICLVYSKDNAQEDDFKARRTIDQLVDEA